MSNAKHTPGPWATPKDDWWVYSVPTGKIVVSEIETQKAADYRLIAAAPDLLSACKKCMVSDGDYITEMATAIAKAEGRS